MSTNKKDIELFQLLLKQVSAVFLTRHAASHSDIAQWKGEDIVNFQEDLREKTQSSISEKWFYTYVKKVPERLPRVDLLHILSNYAGFENWSNFKKQNPLSYANENKKSLSKYWIWGIFLVALSLFGIYQFMPRTQYFHFCFEEMDTKNPIVDSVINIIILNEDESPSYHKTDSLGCFSWKTKEKYIRFVAQSPYYKTDTIFKNFSEAHKEPIRLRTDDYALMLHYYGSSNIKDWKRRRTELQKLIAGDALIFEVLPHQLGVEIYGKDELIDKLTTPTPSLQKLQIISTAYENGQIVKLKFKMSNEK